MPKQETARVSESALKAMRIALRQEVRCLEESVARLLKGKLERLSSHDYSLLGKLPELVQALHARQAEERDELRLHRRAEPALRQSLSDLERLSQLSRQINSNLDLDEILKMMVELTADVVPNEGCMVYLYDERTHEYAKVAAHRLDDDAVRAIQFALEHGVLQDVVGETRPAIVPEIATAMRAGAERSLILVPLRQGGSPLGLLVLLSAQPRTSFFERDLDLLGLLANSVSVAVSNAQLYERTKKLSLTDDLTQLANSRFLNEYLERAIESAGNDGRKLSVLFTDLDGFKSINDRHGHRMGSAVLVEVANILRRCVDDGSFVARFGGDEFVVVLPQAESFKAFLAGEKIRTAIAQHAFLLDYGLDAHLTISIGIATYPDHARSAEELIARSDTAMYVVKNDTKNGVSLSASARSA